MIDNSDLTISRQHMSLGSSIKLPGLSAFTSKSMEFVVESVLQALAEHGFYDLEDGAAGEHVLDMQLRQFPWHSPYGVDWMKYVVWNPRIRLVLEKAFETLPERHSIERPFGKPRVCVLAHSWMYTTAPGHYYRFLPHTKFAIGVFIWAKDSEVDYFSSSHLKELRTLGPPKSPEQPIEPLLEIPGDAVEGLARTRIAFPNGDMVVADGSIVFEIRKGYFIIDLFFPHDQLPSGKMEVPRSKEMERKVEELQSPTIKVNFTYEPGSRANG